MTYERILPTLETWGGVKDIGPSPIRQRNEQEKFYDSLMSVLDVVKVSRPLEDINGLKRFSKTVKTSSLTGLSEISASLFKKSKKLTVYAEYQEGNERRLGLRNGNVGIVFVFDKDKGGVNSATEQKDGGSWNLQKSQEIPLSDALVLAVATGS